MTMRCACGADSLTHVGDLLEGTAGNAAHDCRVRQAASIAGNHEAMRGPRRIEAARRKIHAATLRAALA
jgi:hypothetical protein